jgi:hypothetical protein
VKVAITIPAHLKRPVLNMQALLTVARIAITVEWLKVNQRTIFKPILRVKAVTKVPHHLPEPK